LSFRLLSVRVEPDKRLYRESIPAILFGSYKVGIRYADLFQQKFFFYTESFHLTYVIKHFEPLSRVKVYGRDTSVLTLYFVPTSRHGIVKPPCYGLHD
jgi:hypothetical protein